ncbi:cyclohexadieny/prephenate dehydrogenase [Rhodobium orientis]|uniref:prephenate dehydrogenase n=1 Tax=Rhodobium orientis TaxID=34017 RepID=A0A327JSE5_9HYPH|nr:prephenate/arogenate dehydrogenase family protein [Rhodobium orientis]MBB4303672.1 cyclohexadieny/prephenate dehydrogenase [Rhodobium orientis]MBK5951873.1 cyclohexadienyl dehydrogenase [Rhodobium orientis]RAI28466.1 cyclohexadienyl dehydrogenase [Rhodobium orientis]
MAEPLFDRLALIGIGLIGSSLAQVARREGLVGEIAISTRSKKTLERARELNLGDVYTLDPAEAVSDADLVVLCIPVGACDAMMQTIAGSLKPGAILTDVGSVKMSVIDQIAPHVPDTVHFIPGHPIAGTEHSGPDAGFPDLFQNRWCILTPDKSTSQDAIDRLAAFWRGCGSDVELMEPGRHDLVLAITSHLPQLISYNIVGTADDLETVTKSEVIKYSAGGFRDFTRLAASDPTMWRDVCLHNRDAILEMLGRFSEDLSAMQRAIRWGDAGVLYDLFSRTRSIRKSIIEAGQETPAPDFGRPHEKTRD